MLSRPYDEIFQNELISWGKPVVTFYDAIIPEYAVSFLDAERKKRSKFPLFSRNI